MIPQTSPKSSFLDDKEEILDAISQLIESGNYILGDAVESFERSFADYIGVEHCVGVANGTDALEISLRALGVGPGDLVATVSHTALATVNAIVSAGAEPLWIEIDPDTGLMALDDLERKIRFVERNHKVRLKAIVIVHLYGNPVDVYRARSIADAYGLYLVEDCAQAHGAKFGSALVGSIGDVASFSFYPTKNLPAMGDAGAIVTRSRTVYDGLLLLRQYGWRERYISSVHGKNSRLDPIQAVVLSNGLRKLDSRNNLRRSIAQFYTESLEVLDSIELLASDRLTHHVYHQYVVKSRKRDQLREFLSQRGVATLIHYPIPVHLQDAYSRYTVGLPLPVTEAFANLIMSLPMYPQLNVLEQKVVVERIVEFERQSGGVYRSCTRIP